MVRQDRIGAVAVLVLVHSPVNALTAFVITALSRALAAVAADATVTAVILRGEGRGFSTGVDMREAGQGHLMAEIAALCRQIESFPRPVIAAMHGLALGAGCEVAMAAHYRIAHAATQLGLPQVSLGLSPAAGGTQRLPRLLGAKQALRLMLTGAPIRAPEAMALGLVDRVVAENLGEAAMAMAQENLTLRPTADLPLRDMTDFQAAVAAARLADQGNPLTAPARIIDCVEAAGLLPFAMGLALEETAFSDLVNAPQSHALRHAYAAERLALQMPAEVAGLTPPTLTTLGVLGASDSAVDLTLQAITAGLRVTLCEPDRAALTAALTRIAAGQEVAVAAGEMSEDTRDADWARVSSGHSTESLTGLDLVLIAQGYDTAGLDPATPAALLGAALTGAGLTVPEAAGDLAELSIAPGATTEVILRLVALARQLNWPVVAAGPGGPIELGLRLALKDAEQHLLAQGHAADTLAASLAAYGIGAPTRPLPPMPRGGLALVQTCLAAIAAEGARMLGDGRARRPCDVDAVALISGLMPTWQGGPMFYADRRGLLVLRADLRKLVGQVFAIPTLLDDLIAEGQKFADLNGV